MSQSRIAFFVGVAFLFSASQASAYDTTVKSLHRVDAKIVAAMKKAKMPVTKLVREHFAGWTVAKIKGYAKRQKLDQDAFFDVVKQCELLEAKPISPQIAHMLVTRCNIAGAGLMRGQSGASLATCVSKNATAYGLSPAPTPAEIQVWVDAMKATANNTERVSWANKVMIARYHQKDDKVIAALKKKKWLDNLAVYENLKVSGDRDKFAKRYKLDADAVSRYVAYSDLLRLKVINTAVAHLLYLANIKSVGLLSGQPAPELHQQLDVLNARHKVLPKAAPIAFVEKLIAEAKKFK